MPAFIFLAGVFGRARDKELERQNQPETHGPLFYLALFVVAGVLLYGAWRFMGAAPNWQ